MFDKTSRYAKCEIKKLAPDTTNGNPGHEIRYAGRRFIPSSEEMTIIAEQTVTQGDRLDNITARHVGDPTQFWRLCDANEVMIPEELEQIGKKIRISMINQ
jgi:hypothetical protein